MILYILYKQTRNNGKSMTSKVNESIFWILKHGWSCSSDIGVIKHMTGILIITRWLEAVPQSNTLQKIKLNYIKLHTLYYTKITMNYQKNISV